MKTGPSLNQRQEKKYPQPFVLEPPPQGRYLPGEILSFSLTLVGKAIAYFPFMACSLSLMERHRFGRKRGQITLRAITDGFSEGERDEPLIYDGDQGRIIGPGQVVDFSLMEHSGRTAFWRPKAMPGVSVSDF